MAMWPPGTGPGTGSKSRNGTVRNVGCSNYIVYICSYHQVSFKQPQLGFWKGFTKVYTLHPWKLT